jgi:4'-phosphopantetheinyl transferase
MVHILYTFFPGQLPGGVFDYYLSQLPRAMQFSVMKYRRWQDAQSSLLGKILLMKGLQKHGFNKQELQNVLYTEYNRPYLPSKIDFNISHSGNCVLCAISDHFSLGIDVEEVKPISIKDFDAQFNEHELKSIYNAEDQLQEFYKWWTKKEAVIKADGRGLNVPLKHIYFKNPHEASLSDKNWHVRQIDLDQMYCIHIAATEPLGEEIELESCAF